VIEPTGDVAVRVSYDHRVLDGADVARALASLERFIKHEILAELRYLECVGADDRIVA
jgi:pyruvate/2-oxoglutarate dehydrogenase complex dihydrolipoamide acyltransferase (E2) component